MHAGGALPDLTIQSDAPLSQALISGYAPSAHATTTAPASTIVAIGYEPEIEIAAAGVRPGLSSILLIGYSPIVHGIAIEHVDAEAETRTIAASEESRTVIADSEIRTIYASEGEDMYYGWKEKDPEDDSTVRSIDWSSLLASIPPGGVTLTTSTATVEGLTIDYQTNDDSSSTLSFSDGMAGMLYKVDFALLLSNGETIHRTAELAVIDL